MQLKPANGVAGTLYQNKRPANVHMPCRMRSGRSAAGDMTPRAALPSRSLMRWTLCWWASD